MKWEEFFVRHDNTWQTIPAICVLTWFHYVSDGIVALSVENKFLGIYEPTLKEMAAEGLMEYDTKPFTVGFSERNVPGVIIVIHAK